MRGDVMTPEKIKMRRVAREHAERLREHYRMLAKIEEDQQETDRMMAEIEQRSRNTQLVTQMACGMPISIFTTKEDTDRWFESVNRLANELGVPLTKDKPKLRAV